jgi:hypothetical protein
MMKMKSMGLVMVCAMLSACAGPALAASGPTSGIVQSVFIQKGAGAVARTFTDKAQETKSVRDFGAIGNGTANDTAAINASLTATGEAYLPANYTFLTQGLTLGDGKKIYGPGTLKGVASSTLMTMTGKGATVSGIKVDANGATYTIIMTGAQAVVSGVTFSGNVGHYVLAAGDGQDVSNNVFDGTTADGITTPIVFSGATNYRAFGNTFFDTTGFGIQARNLSYGGQIAYNVFRQPMYTQSVTATASQTVFNFTLSKVVARYGVQVNGTPTATGVSITTADGRNFTATFTVGKAAGTVVKLIGFRALENINVNSRTYDLQVVGNDMDGTGDSGIVIGADYHNGVLDPNNVVADDFPARITVRNNKVKNSAYAGIAQTHAAPDCNIDNNDLQDNAQITDSLAYSSGILATGPNLGVHGNLISNTLTPRTMRFGIVNNSYPTSDGLAPPSQRYGGNTFAGTFERRYMITNQSPGVRRQSVTVEDGAITQYPAQIDLDTAFSIKPADTAYFTYSNTGTGWTRDTATKIGGSASLATNAGFYVNVALPGVQTMEGKILRVDFMAKAASGNSYLKVYTTLAGSPFPVTVNVSDTNWKSYTMYVPMMDIDINSVFIRIGSDTGSANFQHIRISGIYVQ